VAASQSLRLFALALPHKEMRKRVAVSGNQF